MRGPWNNRSGGLPITLPKSFNKDYPAGITSQKRRITSMRTESNSERRPLNRAKIMVVDDDPDLRQALSLRLRANNFDTVNVCDGYSAIAMAQKEKPHLIILDLGLPAGDGFAVLKNLQQYPALSVIPVIVLTARDPEGNEKRTLESGAVAFFQKPADNEELLGVIRARIFKEKESLCMSTAGGRCPVPACSTSAAGNHAMCRALPSDCSDFCA